ncbi:MAG: PH domain-containing protein [bacterium]|nr:PH domain-containing protein [bacterium]
METVVFESPKETTSNLTGFSRHPDISFESQNPNEEVVLLLRQHWAVNIPWFILTVLAVIFPLLYLFGRGQGYFFLPLPENTQNLSVMTWYLLTCGFVIENFLNWYFNVYIVTDHRVIDVDFYGLLYKKVTEAPLGKIQEVSYKDPGLWRIFFDFGDVLVQTAAAQVEIDFHSVPKPQEVVRVISSLIDKANHEST